VAINYDPLSTSSGSHLDCCPAPFPTRAPGRSSTPIRTSYATEHVHRKYDSQPACIGTTAKLAHPSQKSQELG